MLKKENLILVDTHDHIIGYGDKLLVHIQGRLHRAFSILLFDEKGRMIIHQRALTKYHSPGLWTNACCSHPINQETLMEAAARRLPEEMGMNVSVKEIGHFIYQCELEEDLFEHELDHVLVGQTDQKPNPNPLEVADWRTVTQEDLFNELSQTPERFTYWFREMYSQGLLKRAWQFIHPDV